MDFTIPIRLALAALLGGLIGIEREMRDKPAGFRTNILICVGSTLFMSISVGAAGLFGGDATRIGAQIVTGIGFIGAGAVLHSHGYVMGLTTAATIWVVAGVGMALGAGMYGTAVTATAISLVTLYFMSFIENRIQGGRKIYRYSVDVTDLSTALEGINLILKEGSLPPASFNFKKHAGHVRVWFSGPTSRDRNVTIIDRLSKRPEILQVRTVSSVVDFQENSDHEDRD